MDALCNVLERRMLLAKIVWSLVLLGALGGTCFLLANTSQQYSKRRVLSTIRYHPERGVVPFPTISLCPVNPFQSASALRLLADANATPSDAATDPYWRMFMQIEEHLLNTRHSPLSLEEKLELASPSMFGKYGSHSLYTDFSASDARLAQ